MNEIFLMKLGEIAERSHAAADILPQFVLKLALICTFQYNFAQFHQENFVHSYILTIICCLN